MKYSDPDVLRVGIIFHLEFRVRILCMLKLFQDDVEDDSCVPDLAEDIKPRFHRARTAGNSNLGTSNNNHDDSGSTDDEGGDDDSPSEWNLRM